MIISGAVSDCVRMAQDATENIKTIWFSDINLGEQDYLPMKQAISLLGLESEAIIFNAHQLDSSIKAFDANAFGALCGTIVGGGLLILLVPEWMQWKTSKSRFVQRFASLCEEAQFPLYDKAHPPQPNQQQTSKYDQYKDKHQDIVSTEQDAVFQQMIRVVEGHRRRPLVLSSDRGRGKSTLLGKLAAHYLAAEMQCIIVTAPSRKTAETLYQSASRYLSAENQGLLGKLRFLSPDDLHQQKPDADLVLVDEAASIPIHLLADYVRQHSRLIFASTEHGYEGSGRGFAIRFRRLLDKLCSQWAMATLKQPFRWAVNDPLERFCFDALLLDAEASAEEKLAGVTLASCEFKQLKQKELLQNDALLRQIFGLLISAHYQTRPSDLLRLLDDPDYSVFILLFGDVVVATALLCKEGGLSDSQAEAIFNGERRTQGHLVPQILAAHTGIVKAPCLQFDRIMRIAVHPASQQQGFGTAFLLLLVDNSRQKGRADFIATCFGATAELVSFWTKARFMAGQIGIKRDASSGSHSVVMLKALKAESGGLLQETQRQFSYSLPLLLADSLSSLEYDVILALLKHYSQSELELSELELQILNAFYVHQRGYESSLYSILRLLLVSIPQYKNGLSESELQILIGKVLQKRSWAELVKQSGVSGRKQVVSILRQAVGKLVCQL